MTLTNQFMKQISAAAGRTKAELVLKHAKIVNVFTETIEEGDIGKLTFQGTRYLLFERV